MLNITEKDLKIFNTTEELEEFILECTILVQKYEMSSRKISKYYLEKGTKVSHVTISRYLKEFLPQMDSELFLQVNEKRFSTATAEEIKQRVSKAVSLVFEGYTIEQIAELLGENYYTVYDDISVKAEAYIKDESVLARLNNNLFLNRTANLIPKKKAK